MLLILIALISIFTTVQAQNTVGRQQWQYAILTWDVQDSEFTWNTSALYDELDFDTQQQTTQDVWDVLEQAEDAGLVDYLAVMGLSAYELVNVVGPVGGGFIYTFKRPLE